MTTHNETSTVNDNTMPPSVTIIEGRNDQVTIWDATNGLQALLVQITTRLNKLENQAKGDTDKSIPEEFEKLSLDVNEMIETRIGEIFREIASNM